MNKSDLVKEVARRSGLSRRRAEQGVTAALKVLKKALSEEGIHLRGLGRLHARPNRRGYMPAGPGEAAVKPIPKGRAAKLKPTRGAVAAFNTKRRPKGGRAPKTGGGMTEQIENENSSPRGDVLAARGLDIGTSRLVLASGAPDAVKTRAELNAFIEVRYSKFTENILKQNKVRYQLNGSQAMRIYGNESEKFANFFNTEVRRPMLNGILNPTEEHSQGIILAIIEQLVKKTKNRETMRFSIPGALRGDVSPDLVYHEATLKSLLIGLGYNPTPINEGLAVVFSELESENFSGIGISCGGGMCNVCLAFMSIPVMTFGIAKAGDYIDRSVASVTGELPTRVRVIKEESLDLTRPPRNKYESALHVYYDDVIVTLVENLRNALAETKNLPKIDQAIPIVLSGGTAKPNGFLDKFAAAVHRDGFPLGISEIRMASDPLTATARGCLIAAQYDE